ncbi:DUF1456 domain-containing protein [Flavobacterium album]|uniref:DUF1456 domain-containing protein n=1 Tax=Flavobacterium album TaxID=2175091 RepID=A0A2S1R378_9FLAO|nr:DUF1456 family protein [Flavobacterium album]AWH87031.1 DUF1456 domain-containing protein [Flavobacterium album]
MNNNDVFKKLRVALQLRDDQIVDILQLVDFRISKAELGAFFRNADHPNYMECGDQVLRNFLNGLVIHLRGTKENPTNAMDVIEKNKAAVKQNAGKAGQENKAPALKEKPKRPPLKGPKQHNNNKTKKEPIVEKVKFNNGKNKKS